LRRGIHLKASRKPICFAGSIALYLLVKEREEAGATLQFVKDDQRESLLSISMGDFNSLLKLKVGLDVISAEHRDGRRQRLQLDQSAVWLIDATAALSTSILMPSLFRLVPDKLAGWAAGVLQQVLGSAVGFALKRPS
jgi:hypothetical protein